MRLPEVQDVGGSRVLIVWEGHHFQVRGNVSQAVTVLMLQMALKVSVERAFTGSGSARDLANLLRGE